MDHATDHAMDMGGSSGGGGMPVAFVWDTKVTLYRPEWATETTFQYLVALVGVFALCMAQEGLHYFRTAYTISPGELTTPILPKPYKVPELKQRVFGTVLYGLNLSSSYLIMLAVMTCNAGLFVTIILGLSTGHFLYKSKRPMPTRGGIGGTMGESSEACCIED